MLHTTRLKQTKYDKLEIGKFSVYSKKSSQGAQCYLFLKHLNLFKVFLNSMQGFTYIYIWVVYVFCFFFFFWGVVFDVPILDYS